MPPNDASRNLISVFNTFSFLGVILISAIILPALLCHDIRRSKPWFGQLASWLVYSFSFLILVGRQIGPEPPFGICLFQAALIYASPPLCSVGTTCFVIDFYLRLKSAFSGAKVRSRWTKILVLFPFAVYIAVFVEVLLVLQDPSHVQRDPLTHVYCHISTSTPSMVSGILVILSGIITFPLEICIAVLFYRHWSSLSDVCRNNPRISFSIFIRITLFTFTAVMAVGTSAFIISRAREFVAIWSVILPILPTIAAVAFGTQRDIIRAWMFWKKSSKSTLEPKGPVVLVSARSALLLTLEYKQSVASIGEFPMRKQGQDSIG